MNLQKQITESTYLNTGNTYRYRPIIRIAYNFYEKMRYWVYVEDIFLELLKFDGFSDYSLEELKGDLDFLTGKGNFQTIQDTKKTRTIEEFKNRKFRYQISPVTIEFERMIIAIENLSEGMRGSLEVSLMERFYNTLVEFEEVENLGDKKKIYAIWDMLNRDFKHLNENYQDYLSKFSNPNTEELLKTTEFLIFKESFIKYLNEFIKGIQINIPKIGRILRLLDGKDLDIIFNAISDYEEGIYIGSNYDRKFVTYTNREKLRSIKDWFLGARNDLSIGEQILESTSEIIRKITRYALQIADLNSDSGNRTSEYRKIIELFQNCDDEELPMLSSSVFGVFKSKHVLKGRERETESINSSIYDEVPSTIFVKPRVRYGEKTANRVPLKDKTQEKKEKLKEILKAREMERELILSLIVDNKIDFEALPCINEVQKRILLSWLSRIIGKKGKGFISNDIGLSYSLENIHPDRRIELKTDDGILNMPAYILIFKA